MSRPLGLALALGKALGSHDKIAGYAPATNVVPHSMLDLDQAEINAAVSAKDFDLAMFVYENGGGGLCSEDDIKTDVETDPCFEKTTEDAKGNSVKGSGSIRTLEGFATSGAKKMSSEKWWPIYRNFWQEDNYADKFVRDAYEDDDMDPSMKGELIKKGTAYQANWMYVLHEYEDAIFDCLNGNIFDNDSTQAGDSPHAWDEGWAFYAGSLEGDGSTVGVDGAALFNLAQKRGADFGTCTGEDPTDPTSLSKVNEMMLQYNNMGRDKILLGQCSAVQQEFDLIVPQMTVPLIQGTLKYAFKSDRNNPQGSCQDGSCPKEWAEGWAFAAAALPQIHRCDSGVAQMIRDNLDTANDAPMSTRGFEQFKKELETTYKCLGISCEDVGEYQNSAGVYNGMGKCSDADAPIAGYRPQTDVVPHSRIDLDVKEINSLAGAADFEEAIFVYENGGGGRCSEFDIQTTDESSSCFGKTTADAKGNSVKGSGAIRTLQGFATSGEAKMKNWEMFPVYQKYWDDYNYADTFVKDAYEGDLDDYQKTELIKKGIPYHADWMYTLHEFEDAVADCRSGDIYDNDRTPSGAAPHAWDEGWAFYAGSLEGKEGGSDGVLLYNLAQKRGARMGTMSGATARANLKALSFANLGRDAIIREDCDTAEEMKREITTQMTIPLLQGTIEYAYKSDPESDYDCKHQAEDGKDCLKEWAEGWAFAAGVLPQIAQCDGKVGDMVRANLEVKSGAKEGEQMKDGYVALKEAVESTYACLGVTCDDIGAWKASPTADSPEGMEACVGSGGSGGGGGGGGGGGSKKKSKKGVDDSVVIIIACVAAALLLASICLFMKWRSSESKLYELAASNKNVNTI